jgi:nucleotide-binding universal stress UspA family protein
MNDVKAPGPTGHIVVGVDGSPSSVRGLSWALAQGVLTGAEVHAVIAWSYPVAYGAYQMVDDIDWAALARSTMDEALAAAVGDTRKVSVSIVQGQAARVLLEASSVADLLVVGNRGHGGFTGLLLGSVSEQVIAHATCPVLVMRQAPAH